MPRNQNLIIDVSQDLSKLLKYNNSFRPYIGATRIEEDLGLKPYKNIVLLLNDFNLLAYTLGVGSLPYFILGNVHLHVVNLPLCINNHFFSTFYILLLLLRQVLVAGVDKINGDDALTAGIQDGLPVLRFINELERDLAISVNLFLSMVAMEKSMMKKVSSRVTISL